MSFNDTYQTVTSQIVADLERGVRPWAPSWSSSAARLPRSLPTRSTGESYRGVNVLLLWMAAARCGFASSTWLTFNQARSMGGAVRKGEKASHVLFFNRVEKADTREGHEGEERSIAFAKTYAVLNADQIDGLPERFGVAPTDVHELPASAFFAAVGANVRHAGSQPMYRPQPDLIVMPRPEDFQSPDAYVATLGHEHVHWTGHQTRLDRDFHAFGTEAYAVEELVAELGAAFLCATLGVADTQREDHAAYIGHYVKLLRDDKRLLVRAASAAQKAVDYLHATARARSEHAAA
jgi:antirestriction protein ArdC